MELRRRGQEVVFFSHGGHFEHLVEKRGLPIVEIEPRHSEQLIEHMLQIARLEKWGNFLTVDQIRTHVTAEVSAYRQRRLRALVTGFNFTSSISARAVGVPLVWFVQAPSVTEYYIQRLAAFHRCLSLPPAQSVPPPLPRLADQHVGDSARNRYGTFQQGGGRVRCGSFYDLPFSPAR